MDIMSISFFGESRYDVRPLYTSFQGGTNQICHITFGWHIATLRRWALFAIFQLRSDGHGVGNVRVRLLGVL